MADAQEIELELVFGAPGRGWLPRLRTRLSRPSALKPCLSGSGLGRSCGASWLGRRTRWATHRTIQLGRINGNRCQPARKKFAFALKRRKSGEAEVDAANAELGAIYGEVIDASRRELRAANPKLNLQAVAGKAGISRPTAYALAERARNGPLKATSNEKTRKRPGIRG